MSSSTAKFGIGQVVRHRLFSFRGVIFDVDPVFNNTEEWWNAIPEEIRPHHGHRHRWRLGRRRLLGRFVTSGEERRDQQGRHQSNATSPSYHDPSPSD